MSRKNKFLKKNKNRQIKGDVLYNSELVSRLINIVMWRGKKNIARKIVYKALDFVAKKQCNNDKKKALDVFYMAFDNIVPLLEVRSRRVGGSVYQVPREVGKIRGRSLALKWLVNNSSKRKNKTMGERLGDEILDSYEGRGGSVKKKTEVHKMADANRAFSHFSW